MAINYAKHEEEFYGVFKLVSGEEVLGKAVLTEDQGESLVFIQEPVCIQFIDKEINEKKLARAIGFSKWQQLSDEDFYIIREKDIITVSSSKFSCERLHQSNMYYVEYYQDIV